MRLAHEHRRAIRTSKDDFCMILHSIEYILLFCMSLMSVMFPERDLVEFRHRTNFGWRLPACSAMV